MSYSEAFESFRSGDYLRASDLLERAAEESAYGNDLINHTCTLALYQAREFSRLADIAYRIGMALLPIDPASALDYFQRAVFAGLDSERRRSIGLYHEELFSQVTQPKSGGAHVRIAHVIESFASSSRPVDQYVRVLDRSLKARGVESAVFTTESRSSWFFNPSQEPQSTGDGAVVASVEGDFNERSERIAAAIRDAGVSAVLYHTDLSDQIAAAVASRRPAPLQVYVNHGTEMDAELFDGFVYPTQAEYNKRLFPESPAVCIPPASDFQSHMNQALFQTRQAIGIESASTVSVSFGDLPAGSLTFVKAIVGSLKSFSRHFHLFAGGGNVRAIRGLLHSEGVLPRVRFLGPMTDTISLLGLIDFCLVPFPSNDTAGLLDVMAAGKPVVAYQGAGAAEFIGEKDLVATSDAGYQQTTNRLILDNALRLKLGDVMQARFQREFSPEHQADRILKFIESLAGVP